MRPFDRTAAHLRLRGRGRSALAAAVLLGGLASSSCTIVRNVLGPHQSACFKVLPSAESAVNFAGRYSGLSFTSVNDLLAALNQQTGALGALPQSLEVPPGTAVCLVAYRGQFTTGSVSDGWAPTGIETGRFAIVVVRQSDARVLTTMVLENEPVRFVRTYPRL